MTFGKLRGKMCLDSILKNACFFDLKQSTFQYAVDLLDFDSSSSMEVRHSAPTYQNVCWNDRCIGVSTYVYNRIVPNSKTPREDHHLCSTLPSGKTAAMSAGLCCGMAVWCHRNRFPSTTCMSTYRSRRSICNLMCVGSKNQKLLRYLV